MSNNILESPAWVVPPLNIARCEGATHVVAPLVRNPRYLTLDLWRGLACLMILILHAANKATEGSEAASGIGKIVLAVISRMGVGVPFFFVISGYCIAATCDSTRRKPKAPTRYFYRRLRRILPPYWALTIVTILVTMALTTVGQADLVSDEYGFVPHPATLSWSQWLGNLTLTETWRPHLFGDSELKIVGPSWTLCYEEQFYAVCGILILVAPRRFFAGVAGVTLLTLAIMPFGGEAIQGFFFDGRWLMFAEGVAVYYLLNYTEGRRRGLVVFSLLLAAIVGIRWGIPGIAASEFWRQRVAEFIASTAFALVITFLHRWDRQSAESRALRPIAICGQMCYSLYLVHWPVSVILTNAFYRSGVRGVTPTLLIVVPVTVLVSIAAAWIFHVKVERAFLNSPVEKSYAESASLSPSTR